MAEDRTIDIDSAYGDLSPSRTVFVLSALIYPFWHLAAPSGADDPWWAWWAVAACFLGVALAARISAVVARHALLLLHLCAFLTTLQLYVLAYLNDMQAFYAVGSVMSVLAVSVSIRTRALHLVYAGFLFVLTAVLIALDPEGRKVAYWGGMLTIVAASYFRLSGQLTAAKLTREHQQWLEERVKARTVELSGANRRLRGEMEERARLEEELRVSQKLEAVGRLAGGIAHEFNNLLTRIRLYAGLAVEELPEGSPAHDDIGEIEKAGRQAAALTRQLLTFSRRGEVRSEVVDVDEVIESASKMLGHLLGENADLVCDTGAERHLILADRGQLEQVLVNLLLNARDAMAEGGRVTIATSLVCATDDRRRDLPEVLGDDEYVLLTVTDSGVGMDADTRARAFDPFFTRKPVNQGTGLGLSVVYGIVNQARGHVRVLSEPGKGACFELYWPRARELVATPQEVGAKSPRNRGDERILLVEDEADLRAALVRLLASNGYQVIDAGDPAEALGIAEASDGPIDLLLTDVVMPGMNGVDLAEAICAVHPETRVLLVSGHMVLDASIARALPAGVSFLAKPFEADELTAAVREVLDAPLEERAATPRGPNA
jgi:signal transduction histidine kinase/ActR/RegA family two-component response regulator